MAARYLADTNVVIDYLSANYPDVALNWLDEQFEREITLSIISRIEALAFQFPDPEERNKFQEFIAEAIVIPLNDAVANKTIEVRLHHKLKLPDAIIVATALVFDLTLLTRNVNDFKKVTGLQLLNPWSISI